ncbi:uncharacterized protein LOC108668655 [Hyalella azteca]|uniref:Uncharacterized protein LOC108668655 n=1 Tax=Hyalella azteca TaxID=294128 RepID=A0A8B7NCS4_HYAAZ|nr:uncharacterized protein LOC108668655 [Hyalella azteca]
MKKLQVRVFALGIVATVLGLGLATASYPDSVNVVTGRPGPLSCGAVTSTSVRFRSLTMPGSKSLVTYRRFSISTLKLTAAVNATKRMSATDVVQCARQAALEDMAGFSFNGTCTAYKFGEKLCSCSTAEPVIYVTDSSVTYETPSSVPFSAASYVNVTVENTGFKQYKLVNFFLDVIENNIAQPPDISRGAATLYFFPQDDGIYKAIRRPYLDLASCVTDSPCGIPVLVNNTLPAYYLLNECGRTIELTADLSKSDFVIVYSHPGFGCKAFPDGPAYNCTVTFTSTTTLVFKFVGFYFDAAAATCDGYTLRASYDTTPDADFCTVVKDGRGNTTFTLLGQALAKTFKAGFLFTFS